jgi:hypothetical protein
MNKETRNKCVILYSKESRELYTSYSAVWTVLLRGYGKRDMQLER